MKHTVEVLGQGREDIEILVSQVEQSVTNGADVADKLKELSGYVEKMHEIVDMISSIANQTSMLAAECEYRSCKGRRSRKGLRSSGVSGNCYGRTDQECNSKHYGTDQQCVSINPERSGCNPPDA